MKNPLKKNKYFWGIDCGSTEIKVVVLDENKKILHKRKERTLFPLMDHVNKALTPIDPKFSSLSELHSPLLDDGKTLRPGHQIVVTGYGRNHIGFIPNKLTEIKAHFQSVRYLLETSALAVDGPYTIIDIGGQDSKVIVIKDNEIHHFVINRKCASGTGAFIEELAHRLRIDLRDLTEIGKKHDKKLILNSYCTVFACQEVIKVLMEGEKLENLIHSLYVSVAKRVLEMTTISTPSIIFTGGVMNHHSGLLEIFQERLQGKKLLLAPEAQYCGAIGAAIEGIEL